MILKSIIRIRAQFYANVPLNKLNWQDILDECCIEVSGVDVQQLLLYRTLLDDLNVRLPVRLSYQKSFLKFIITYLEAKNVDIADCLYEQYVICVNSADSKNVHLHFFDETQEIIISIAENLALISNGTTGLSTWPASRLLAEYCVQNSHIFRSRNILELGCGTGLLGLAVSKICKPKKYIFSDCHPDVLNIVEANIGLSLDRKIDTTGVSVENLPWENITTETFKKLSVDVIVGADIIFDKSAIDHLVKSFRVAHETRSPIVLVASAVRNRDTYDYFAESVSQCGGTLRDVDFKSSGQFYPWADVPLKIVEVLFR